MAINPHRRGGPDIPVTDGGTGASAAAAALANLGGLDTAAHAAIDHTGVPGVAGKITTIYQDEGPATDLNNGTSPFLVYGFAGGDLTVDGDMLVLDFHVLGRGTTGNNSFDIVVAGTPISVFVLPSPTGVFRYQLRIVRTGATTARVLLRHDSDPAPDGSTAGATGVTQETYFHDAVPLTWASSWQITAVNPFATSSTLYDIQILKYAK